ncbi:DNRLRE domain-containing protein, partial [Thermodesulfobacteriota bacterium]
NGYWHLFLMNGATVTPNYQILLPTSLNLEPSGIADFNNDGKADVLLRNSDNGYWHLFLMNGATVTPNYQILLPTSLNLVNPFEIGTSTPEVPPTAPSGLSVGSPTTSSLTLNWTDTSDNENGFSIYRATSSGGVYTYIGSVSANTTTYPATGLASATLYWFKITAYNTVDESAFSNTASGTTSTAVPNAPTNINATNITTTSARIYWTDNSNNETGFQIGTCSLVSSDGLGTYCHPSFWTLKWSTGANVTYKDITNLQSGTGYSYYVRSYNSGGASRAYRVQFTTASPTTTTFYPSMDNLVLINSLNSAIANTAYSNSIDLGVGCNWSYSYITYLQDFVCAQSLVQFNLASLSGKTIQNATLRLEVYSYGVGYYPRTWHVWANATSWNSNVTWNQVSGMLHYTGYVIEGLSPPGSYGYMDIDVTTMVQNWASGSWNNYGFIFGSDNYNFPYATSFDAFAFYSSADTGGGKPKLIVTYQ